MSPRQKRTLKTPPIVEVLWDDAYALPTGSDKLKRPVQAGYVKSCGYLIFENDERIVLTSNYDADEKHVNGGIVIPLGMIVERRQLG